MARLLATILLLAGATRAGEPEAPSPFAPTLPDGVGEVSRWEIVTGSFETDTERGSYRFYVNPVRPALYQLMRYCVELRVATRPEEKWRGSAERVAFIRRPGVAEPMSCWERLPGAEPSWRELVAGTDEYLLEMGLLMRVLAVHRAARASSSP